MKKLALILSLLSIVLWNCKNFDERTKFDVTYVNRVAFDSSNTNVESGMLISDTLIMDFKQDLKDHDSRPGQLEYVRMIVFSVELDRIKSPAAKNMNFLQSVEFFQIGEGKDELLIARTDAVPTGIGYFEMSIAFDLDKDLEDLLINDISTYKVVYHTKSQVNDTIVLKLAAKYEVDTRKMGI